MKLKLLSQIGDIEVIAADSSIRELPRLIKIYGTGRWRKLKGIAKIKLPDGYITNAELHWYEAHGIGKKEIKIKRYLD
jgi:hypothetical protein